MADQEQNIYAPRKLEGPFADAIDPTIVSQPHQSPGQFNGYEGTVGKVAGIASKFLAGVGQGRMMKALADEKIKGEKVQRFMNWGQSVLNDPNLTPEARSKFQQDWTRALMAETAGALKEGKGKHPLLDAMGHIVTGLAGGEIKGSKFDLKAMDKVFTDYAGFGQDPKNQMSGRLQESSDAIVNAIGQKVQQLRKDGKPVDQQAVSESIDPALISNFDKWHGTGKAYDLINKGVERFAKTPEPAKPPQAGSVDERRMQAAERLKKSREGQSQQPQPPGVGAEPGASVDTPLRQKLGATTTIPGLPPPPPGTQTPKLTPEARDYLVSYNLLSSPKEMNVDGKKRQVIYSQGADVEGVAIEPGFIDAQTGEYIHGQIASTDKKSNPPMRLAHDDKKKYGGGDYYINEDTGKPLRDADGDIVRPREQATSTGQRAVDMAIQKEYDTFTTELNSLDKEAQSNIMRISAQKDATGNLQYPPGPALEAKKKEIYDGVIKRKAAMKEQTRSKIQNLGTMFGVPVQPFMTDEQRQAIGDPDQSAADTGFQFPAEVGADDAKQWDFK